MSAVPACSESDKLHPSGQACSLSVLIPCHNEAATVGKLLSRVRAALPDAEIIVVDDGSGDSSPTIIGQWQEPLDLIAIFFSERSGKGAAVREALKKVTRPWVVIQDADLEYEPRDLQKLLTTAQANPESAVYGSRYLHRGKAAGGSLAPFVGVKVLGLLVKLLYGKYLSDTHTCYKMLPTAFMKQFDLQSTGFELCAEITSKLLRENVPIIEVPISYHPRTAAAGKKIGVRDFFRAVGTYWRCRFPNFPTTRKRNEPTYFLYLVSRFLIGALLVIAGAIKLAPWREIALTDWLVLPANAVIAIGVGKFLLGCLVLSFVAWTFIQRVCRAVFAAYIGILLLQLYSGETACQCLGSRSLPLWWMLGLDALLFLSLWWQGKSWQQPLANKPQGFFGEVFSSTRFALPVLALLGVLAFGSLDAAIGYLTGSRLVAKSTSQYAGRLAGGETCTAAFELTNYSVQPIHVLGAKATCRCMALDDLPLVLPAGESGTLRIRMKGGSSPTPHLQREAATLIFDDLVRTLTLTVSASVTPTP